MTCCNLNYRIKIIINIGGCVVAIISAMNVRLYLFMQYHVIISNETFAFNCCYVKWLCRDPSHLRENSRDIFYYFVGDTY